MSETRTGDGIVTPVETPQSGSTLIVDRDGPIGIVTLSNPGRKNALSTEKWVELAETIGEFANDSTVRTIVITGAEAAFCSGVDLQARGPQSGPTDPIICRSLLELGRCSKPTIAAVEGACVAAAWSLALATDLLIADETAFFEFPFPSRGMQAGAGILWYLSRQLSPHELGRVIYRAVRYDATTALRHGLLNEVVAQGHALQRSLAIAHELARLPEVTVAISKVMMRRANAPSLQRAMDGELLESKRNSLSEEALVAYREYAREAGRVR